MRAFFVIGFLLAATAYFPQEDPLAWVDPTLGSGGHGHVFVGASVPFGMAQPGPTSIPQGWDWCSGYHASDSTVVGFSQTHLSGTGCADLFDITVMPVTGPVRYGSGRRCRTSLCQRARSGIPSRYKGSQYFPYLQP